MLELSLIVWATVAIAIAAVLVLLALVARRALSERRAVHEAEIRKIIQGILFKYLAEPSPRSTADGLGNLLNLHRRDRPVLRKLAIDLFHLIQGSEREKLTELLLQIGFREQCLRDLRSRDTRQRESAAAALEIFSDGQSSAALIQALDDRRTEVCMAAVDSLFHADALPPLDILVRKLAERHLLESLDIRALFRDIARRSATSLTSLAEQMQDDLNALRVIADAMSEASDYSVLDPLIRWAEHPDLELRTKAMRSLGNLQHPAAAAVVVAGLRDQHWQVRAVAARAAGQIGLDDSLQKLNFLLDDKNWWVRFRAAESLFRLGTAGIATLDVRATYSGCGGFGRGARMAALILDEHGLHSFSDAGQGLTHA